MGGFKIDARNILAGAGLGLGVGAGISYLLCRRAFNKKLDAEIAQADAHYNARLKHILAPEPSDEEVQQPKSWMGLVANTLPAPVPIRNKATGYGAGPNTHRGGGTAHDPREGLDPEPGEYAEEDPDLIEEPVADIPADVDTSRPYTISVEEAEEVEVGWQMACVTWYALDNTLTDEHNQPIPDVIGTVGALSVEAFGGISGSPHLRYVKNHRLEIIFEITLVRGSFADEVLGYGDPARVKERKKSATAKTS